MKIPILFAAFIWLSTLAPSVFSQEIPKMPPGITLLKSTKADLMKVAAFKGENILTADFEYDGERIEAEIAPEPCTWHGWNVPGGTIISLNLYPKSARKVDKSVLTNQGFDLYVTDNFSEYYTNKLSGQQYFLRSDSSFVSIKYHPTPSDSKFRCAGFPEFDPRSEVYSTYESFRIVQFHDWDEERLYDLKARLTDASRLKGVVIIYFEKKDLNQAQSIQRKITEYLESQLRLPRERFEVRLGGLRDENVVETFLLLTEQPDPVPRPKYSSPMVFGGEK